MEFNNTKRNLTKYQSTVVKYRAVIGYERLNQITW